MEQSFLEKKEISLTNQFKLIFKSKKDTKRLLEKLSQHELKNNTKYSQKKWYNIIYKYIKKKYDDNKIYNRLRLLFKQENLFYNQSRAAFLALNIIKFIPKNTKINSLLDYGCASGTITKEIANKLNIPKKNIYGADIEDYNILRDRVIDETDTINSEDGKEIARVSDFNFILLNENNYMPTIKNNSIDLITVSMVLHHVSDIETTLSEFKRILTKDGIIIIREHDISNEKKEFIIFLDILHGLYELVWSEEITNPDFVINYKAYYKTKNEWTRLFNKYGFKAVSDTNAKNLIKSYYCVYKVR